MKVEHNMTNEPALAAKIAVGASVATATASLLSHAQAWLSLIASVVAIIAGLFAISNYLKTGGTLNPLAIMRARRKRKTEP